MTVAFSVLAKVPGQVPSLFVNSDENSGSFMKNGVLPEYPKLPTDLPEHGGIRGFFLDQSLTRRDKEREICLSTAIKEMSIPFLFFFLPILVIMKSCCTYQSLKTQLCC